MGRAIRLGALTVLALAVACGSAATQPAPAGTTAAAAKVTYASFKVAPPSIDVKAGQSVTWTNTDTATHTITAGKPGAKTGTFDQKVAGGATASVTFDKAGTFDYFCEFHQSMVGTVVVK